MVDLDAIRFRYQGTAAFLDERGRRLFAANEALAHGFGGVTAAAAATGLARSTINRGIRELRSGQNPIGNRVRRAGGGRKSAVTHQPGLPAAFNCSPSRRQEQKTATRGTRGASCRVSPATVVAASPGS